MKILPFSPEFLEAARAFTDREIGDGYFSKKQLMPYIGEASFVLVEDDQKTIAGLRLTLTPAQLRSHPVFKKLSPELWQVDPSKGAYFQSLFVNEKHQGSGWGRRLSEKSIEALRFLGARAVACHSWKESPNNSSMRYLQKMDFQIIKEHKKFWYDVDYNCTRCGRPCVCTAVEMVKYL